MRLEKRSSAEATGTILTHNVSDEKGTRILKKGILLTGQNVAQLIAHGQPSVTVAILEPGDIREDEAAAALASALQTEELFTSKPSGGRVNLRTRLDGLLQVDAERLLQLNMLSGLAFATRRQHAVVGPNQDTDNVGTLKIIPYAIRGLVLERAIELASEPPGIIRLRPFQEGRRASLLLVGEPTVQDKLRSAYLPPTETRLKRLRAELIAVEYSDVAGDQISDAAARLAASSDLLIIAGQTSIMDENDVTMRALRRAGADTTLSGAPVEPGNLLALAYFPDTPVLCAPGCAKGLRRNVVDLILPRLLLGDRLSRHDIAELGLGGFLTAAERAGDWT
jgi:hypothetical protein